MKYLWAVCLAGCAHVAPAQRGKLDDPAAQFHMDPIADMRRDSVLEVGEGATFRSAEYGVSPDCGCK